MKPAEFEFVTNHIIESIVEYLMEDYNMPMAEAFDTIYNSATYQKIKNKNTGLYRYSPAYNYEFLKQEMIN